ncbi:bifunctional Nucleoside diphosphate kinase-like domain/Nucleoside diphosphate kinase-like domain superfamily/Nucleoside diphosphate kinase [Babesia duncani]|uniref:nucleoside-diphosphate kinase n=1 Tax=Babesia duncani TaxID=323732 RepID=A0AAD9UPA1_9APIC|nr:bifunctional Nucleoside diphosphate kinase-like domain/Nucleoside diphosphate kinase-like domain superfamily/Nucleoside diphosphate kinase [Babesia duncani]
MEKTFIMIKPDGVHRGLIGETIRRFEQKGLKIVAAKFVNPAMETVEKHYEEHAGKPFFPTLISFIGQGPVFCTIWEGPSAIEIGRSLLGSTNPAESAPGTIRGDFGVVTSKNLVHASSSQEDATRECQLWFTPDEIVEWQPNNSKWVLA